MTLKIILFFFLSSIVCYGATTHVIRVIDGDTFETDSGDKVRMIGINAPEISDIFGLEAKKYLSGLILNKKVELKSDNYSRNKDRYQRLLRYVFIDNVDINKKMILEGYAFANLKYNFNKSNSYKKSQILAKELRKGFWGGVKNQYFTLKNYDFKTYVVSFLLILLIFIGLFNYYK
jgi:micrococcal nuclease